ncbi:hypothetical protein M8J76_010254 [Diaphorina citri]|nr:hypothetical protein M8J76_010254 [Diaphorina citri]
MEDIKVFLIPWILTVFMAIIIELAHTVYLISLPSTTFRPVTAFTFTVAFFTFCLNSYSLLCVISLYQEYKVGRGTAHYETVARLAAMQHMAAIQATATATSVLSTKRNVTYHVSPPRSPDEGGGTRKNSGPRKHVQFIATHPHRTSRDEEKLHAHWSVAEPSVSDNDSSVQSTSDQTPVWVTGNGSRNGPTCQVHDLAPLILSGHPQSSTRAMPFTTDL